MITEKTLKRSGIAYVYRENPALRREDNLKFYDLVTTSGVEVSDFSIQGQELILTRRAGPEKDGIQIRVGAYGEGPQLRLLMVHQPVTGTPAATREVAGLVWEAFQSTWGAKLTEPVLTEVTLDFTAPAPGGNSRDFLRSSVAGLKTESINKLGRNFEGFGVRLMSAPEVHFGEGPPPPLAGADALARVETFMEDLSQLFIQVTAKWPSLSVPKQQLPAPVREHLDQLKRDTLQVNIEAREPNFYLEQVYDFVGDNVLPFLAS